MDSSTLRSPIESLGPRKPTCVQTDTKILDVIKTMKENKFGCVCVVQDRRLVGILTERDILTKVVGGNLDAAEVCAKDVMTPNPEYLFPDDQIAFALNRMHVGGFRHIPLTDLGGMPTGLVSVRDIAAFLVKSLQIDN